VIWAKKQLTAEASRPLALAQTCDHQSEFRGEYLGRGRPGRRGIDHEDGPALGEHGDLTKLRNPAEKLTISCIF
jgi:hypothetical protein